MLLGNVTFSSEVMVAEPSPLWAMTTSRYVPAASVRATVPKSLSVSFCTTVLTFVPSASKMATFRRVQSSVMSVAARVKAVCSNCVMCRMTFASFFMTISSSRIGFSHAATSRARTINKYFFMACYCLVMMVTGRTYVAEGKSASPDVSGELSTR